MFDRLVADGDRTTTGGVVIARSNSLNEKGSAYARKENHATCGNCKGSWPIYGTATDWMDDGQPLVKDSDRVLCPCGKNYVLAASSSNAFYSDGKDGVTAAPLFTAPVYDQIYKLRDRDARPLANVRYRVCIGSEVLANGLSDLNGLTERITTDAAKRLVLEIQSGD